MSHLCTDYRTAISRCEKVRNEARCSDVCSLWTFPYLPDMTWLAYTSTNADLYKCIFSRPPGYLVRSVDKIQKRIARVSWDTKIGTNTMQNFHRVYRVQQQCWMQRRYIAICNYSLNFTENTEWNIETTREYMRVYFIIPWITKVYPLQ